MRRTSFVFAAIAATCLLSIHAKTDKYRLVWDSDPATSITIGWNQVSGFDPVLYYSDMGHQDALKSYSFSAKPTHSNVYLKMSNQFVHLEGLKPDTAYYFVVADSEGPGRQIWFKTAPAERKAFTFIAGGDSRSQQEPRQDGNKLVAKLRPLFVLFGGDYTFRNTVRQWQRWLDDWQLTISEDGRMYPIIPTHGNHENSARDALEKLFNTKNADSYASLGFAGNLLRVWGLNSELTDDDRKWQRQTDWLATDLETHKDTMWKVAIYHKPMRPHRRSKSENPELIEAWAGLFQRYHVSLAVESDSHLVKRTYPIIPSSDPGSFDGFIRDDEKGTIYVGEGSWGAPLRKADDSKPWTMASGSFFQFKWIHVHPTEMVLRSIKFDEVDAVQPLTDETAFNVPTNVKVWAPETGAVLRLPFDASHESYSEPAVWQAVVMAGSSWSYYYSDMPPPAEWINPEFDASMWKTGKAPLGYGEGEERTILNFGPDKKNKPITAYFRKELHLAPTFNPRMTDCSVVVDDGCVLWINGKEAGRYNMPAGSPTPQTLAASTRAVNETKFYSVSLSELLKPGRNVIAVEVHQIKSSSSDLRFDMQLKAK